MDYRYELQASTPQNVNLKMKNPFKRLFFIICPWNFLVLLSAAHEHSLLFYILNHEKDLTVEDDLNNLPNPRKDDEVYLEEGFTIAECTGQFELALEVIY